MTNTPALAIDVDGVAAPFVHTKRDRRLLTRLGYRSVDWKLRYQQHPDAGRWTPRSELWLNPAHGRMLARFSVMSEIDLHWCSIWSDNTNRVVSPYLGLPRLPSVDFHGHASGSRVWKWDAVADAFAGRPLAWLDDGFASHRRQRARSRFDASRRGLPTLLHEIDPWVGLQASDLVVVRDWLRLVSLAW